MDIINCNVSKSQNAKFNKGFFKDHFFASCKEAVHLAVYYYLDFNWLAEHLMHYRLTRYDILTWGVGERGKKWKQPLNMGFD